jgi:hypothetical protein
MDILHAIFWIFLPSLIFLALFAFVPKTGDHGCPPST